MRSNTVVFKPALHLTGPQVSFLCSQYHYVSPLTLFWKFSSCIGILSFLYNLCQVDLFDQVSRSNISVIDKPEALTFEALAEHVEGAVNNKTLIPEDFKHFLTSFKL